MTHIRKRIRKLSTAVFRGSRSEYSFDVFPISPSITDAPAVFIFSRRFVDKRGRAHHAVSCVGQARSLVTEIKRHRRAKCIKGSDANVICVLKEADPNVRADLVRDISEARSFSCVDGKFDPVKPSQGAKRSKKAKIIPISAARKDASAKGALSQKSQSKNAGSIRGRKVSPADEAAETTRGPKIKKGGLPELKPKVDRGGVSQLSSSKRKKLISQRSRAKVADGARTRLKRAA